MSTGDMAGGWQSAESDFDTVYFILSVAAKLLPLFLESLCISVYRFSSTCVRANAKKPPFVFHDAI